MTRAFQDHQLRQYLLGDLPAADEGELEVAYFRDSELLARVELARDDLTDDYAAARLSTAEREKFERRMLATPEGRDQLAFAKALREVAAVPAPVVEKPVWYLDRRWLSLAALVTVAVGALLAWRVVTGPASPVREATSAGDQSAARSAQPGPTTPPGGTTPDPQGSAGDQPRPTAKPVTPTMTLATLILTADLERSRGFPPTLLTSTGATHVDVVVPRGGLTSGSVPAQIHSVEGTRIWSGSLSVPSADSQDPRPRARVAISALPPGDYLFSIESTGSTDSTALPQYYFRVRAR